MSLLFEPLRLRDLTLRNRIVVSPMSQYAAVDGLPTDWHLPHLSRFALGGAGLVFTEATAVEQRGRRTHGDLGLWNDAQVEPLRRIAMAIQGLGAKAGIQLGHAGRKASERRPWHGESPLDDEDTAARGEPPWPALAPSPLPYRAGWPTPAAMDDAAMRAVADAFAQAAQRADRAGFDAIELYAGHGFLLHQFLSPVANVRDDDYGGSFENRARFPLEVVDAVRAHWPDAKPLFVRLSVIDWVEGGLTLDDSVAIAELLGARGVDVFDCSTGGIGGDTGRQRIPVGPAFQAPYAKPFRDAGHHSMAVGLIRTAHEAEAILQAGQADLVALAREMLNDPNWPLHAAGELGLDEDFERWPPAFGWWLNRRAKALARLRN